MKSCVDHKCQLWSSQSRWHIMARLFDPPRDIVVAWWWAPKYICHAALFHCFLIRSHSAVECVVGIGKEPQLPTFPENFHFIDLPLPFIIHLWNTQSTLRPLQESANRLPNVQWSRNDDRNHIVHRVFEISQLARVDVHVSCTKKTKVSKWARK